MAREKKALAIQLKVAEAKHRDLGKGRARLDLEAMEALGLKSGDVMELIGKQSTLATAWPSDGEDRQLGIIRIDGRIRKNAAASLNEYVTVRKANVKEAKVVTLAPVGSRLTMDEGFAEFVKNRLIGLAVTERDDVSIIVLGHPIVLTVVKLRPKGHVKIENSTKVAILPESGIEHKERPRITYEEIGGLSEEIRRLREIVELPLSHPEVFQKLGIDPPRGILLHGPPGCGKTLLAKALANESEANFFTVNGPEIMNKYYGETEARLREIFKEAKEKAPGIIFIDEIDAIAPSREDVFGDVEKRLVAQLLALMDGLSDRGDVIVIGATNRPDSVDTALRRPGRFDREVEINVPNKQDRLEIIKIHTRGMPLDRDVNLEKLAEDLHGYTGADLKALCREAALKALRRYLPGIDHEDEKIPPEILEKMTVTMQDFKVAYKEIIPTALREFYTEIPSVKWIEIGGLEEVKRILHENVIWSIRQPERFQKIGIKPPRGILMYGPPGCGKTILARALASESGANFITVRGPEVLSKWVGESEKAVRDIFRKAKASSPCIVFFDEIDSIAKPRASFSEDLVGERVLSQLLTEIDNTKSIGEVYVVGATNRPDLIDLSLLRPGRLDLLVYVQGPDEDGRFEILKIVTRPMPLADDVDLREIAGETAGYSGADLEALCREAAIAAMERDSEITSVSKKDFENAFTRIRPTITRDVESWYKHVYERIVSKNLSQMEKQFYG